MRASTFRQILGFGLGPPPQTRRQQREPACLWFTLPSLWGCYCLNLMPLKSSAGVTQKSGQVLGHKWWCCQRGVSVLEKWAAGSAGVFAPHSNCPSDLCILCCGEKETRRPRIQKLAWCVWAELWKDEKQNLADSCFWSIIQWPNDPVANECLLVGQLLWTAGCELLTVVQTWEGSGRACCASISALDNVYTLALFFSLWHQESWQCCSSQERAPKSSLMNPILAMLFLSREGAKIFTGEPNLGDVVPVKRGHQNLQLWSESIFLSNLVISPILDTEIGI